MSGGSDCLAFVWVNDAASGTLQQNVLLPFAHIRRRGQIRSSRISIDSKSKILRLLTAFGVSSETQHLAKVAAEERLEGSSIPVLALTVC
jgi:hypothetical protein